jgi:hypothetical protein
MKKLKLYISSDGGLGGILGGIGGIITGLVQEGQAPGEIKQGNDYYNQAYTGIPDEYSSEMIASRDEINRRRLAYQNGTVSNAVNQALGKEVATGDENIAAQAGGNTGSVLKAIMSINSQAGNTLNKNDEQDQTIGNQLLGLENTETNDIQTRADAIRKQRNDFNVMRGSQQLSLGYGNQMGGEKNIVGGLTALGSGVNGLI